ncbi:hypothetical protein, partial [Streptosporangium vulgare]
RSRNPFHRHLPLNLQKQDHAEINSYTTSLDVTLVDPDEGQDLLVFMAEPGSPSEAKLRRLITMAGGEA